MARKVDNGDPAIPTLTLKHDRPEVAALIARTLIDHNMDYEAAVTKLLTKEAEARGRGVPTPQEVATYARTLSSLPSIQTAIQDRLVSLGLGDDAQKRVIALLWNAALDKRNDKRWAPAMQMLVKLTGMDKQRADKPATLRIDGIGDMVKEMMDGRSVDPERIVPEPDVDDEDADD